MNPGNIRGMLLEEALLHLLRRSGYSIIDAVGTDKSLRLRSAGLEVAGRGGWHQVDAIADYLLSQPFSHPQRLIVEAKCYPTDRVGIDVVRGAVGLMKDINEHWLPTDDSVVTKKRYHYQSAVISATDFTSAAQQYAFAQDVYLIPVAQSVFMRPIVDAIRRIDGDSVAVFPGYTLGRLRAGIRGSLLFGAATFPEIVENRHRGALDDFVEACWAMNYGLMGVFARRFPVFLAPARGVMLEGINGQIPVRIRYNDMGWFLESPEGQRLFSFDLPDELFDLYAKDGELSRESALELKQQHMTDLQAVITDNGQVRVVNFMLDQAWVDQVRGRRRSRSG